MGVRWMSVVAVCAALGGCGGTGVCAGYSSLFDEEYCHDDWTRAECEDWDAQEINGAQWTFHSGQTCADRGF
ncbi:MAG: hypothetical protein R3F61_20220 [Myxococcota bacterium]